MEIDVGDQSPSVGLVERCQLSFAAETFEDRLLAVVRSTEHPAEIMVIRLRHANALEVANTLRRLAPSGVTVVPDLPSNSLILTGPAPKRSWRIESEGDSPTQ